MSAEASLAELKAQLHRRKRISSAHAFFARLESKDEIRKN
jgi:hypothetical protein